MRTFLRQQLEEFLGQSMRRWAGRSRLSPSAVGGSAPLRSDGRHARHRYRTNVEAVLAVAAERARFSTGLDIPLQKSGVADAPVDFESWLERVLPRLRWLKVFVPEKHDLVLMKAMRMSTTSPQ